MCRLSRFGLAGPALLAALIPLWAAEPAAPGADVKSSREILAKWVETQQILAREKKDWQQGREILNSRIDIVRGEVASLEEKLSALRKTSAESGQKKGEVSREEEGLKDAAASVASWTAGLEKDLRSLEPRLPEPVRAKVEPLYGRMPADPDHTQVTIAERLQNVVGILNEVNKFNGEITMVTEVRTLASGQPTEVRTIYVGLAQAYYVSPKGEAGVGRPGEKGWTWEPAADLAPHVTQAVEILQAKAKPSFVPLPVKIQ